MFPHTRLNRHSYQRGAFLLEALVSLLIVAFGILGSVGLLARSMQNVDDSRLRGEAAYLANGLIGQMWVSDRTTANLDALYGSVGGGAGYVEFKALVAQRLPNAIDPVVTVAVGPNPGALPTTSIVTITMRWKPPGQATPHRHDVSATIGTN